MTEQVDSVKAETLLTERKPSAALLNAALLGLFGTGLAACGTKEKEKLVYPPAPELIGEAEDRSFSESEFATYCKERGGVMQIHASCAGVNSCKGASFSHGKLQEHSCKGMNSCAGMSCVDLPQDSGLSGEEILTATPGANSQCSWCHGPGTESFQLPVPHGVASTDEEKAQVIEEFLNKPLEYHVSILAFGVQGVNEDGTAYSHMPGYHTVYSRAEIERLIEHIRSMPITIKELGGDHSM